LTPVRRTNLFAKAVLEVEKARIPCPQACNVDIDHIQPIMPSGTLQTIMMNTENIANWLFAGSRHVYAQYTISHGMCFGSHPKDSV